MSGRASLRRANTPAREQAYDRRLAAIHEAGHAVMARRAGAVVQARIFPSPDAVSNEKTWVGDCTSYTPLDHETRRRVGIAGLVAEKIWQGDFDGDVAEPWDWECYLMDTSSMSASDWAWSGGTPGDPDEPLMELAASVAILLSGDLWSEVTTMSRELMHGAAEARAA